MIDMSDTIAPKSDQLNADDLLVGPRTITITGGKRMDSPEQPVALHFEGDNGKPYKPCKSMRRVLVNIWGADASKYIGRSMTIYRDPGVQFGGQQVGGIRISHMSHIEKSVTMALTATRANRKPFKVIPLSVEKQVDPKPVEDKIAAGATVMANKIIALKDRQSLEAFTSDEKVIGQRKWLADNRPELAAKIDDAVRAVLESFESDVPFDDIPMSEAAE